MMKLHESFSTRIFLPAAPVLPESTTASDLRDFWWFLRAGREQAHVAPRARRDQRPTAQAVGERRKA